MRALVSIANVIDLIVTKVGKFFAWAGFLLIMVTIFDVLTRSFTQTSWESLRELIAWQQAEFGSTKLQELEWHFHTALFALCIGWTYLANGHVRIDLFRDNFSRRRKVWIEAVGVVFFLLPYCALLVWFGYQFAYTAYLDHEVSASATGLSNRWIIKMAIPFGFGFLFLAGVAVLLRKIVYLFGPPELHALMRSSIIAEEEKQQVVT